MEDQPQRKQYLPENQKEHLEETKGRSKGTHEG
jgi:hypothetical protein